MKTDKEVIETNDDLEMMRRPHMWPCWPILPVKKPAEHGRPEIGVIIQQTWRRPGATRFAFVPGATMFETILNSDPRIQRGDDEMLQRIVADGWIVD